MKIQKIRVILILFIFLTTTSLVHGTSQADNRISQWRILDWNEANPVIWEWGSTSFIAQNGSLISYNMSYYDPSNFTHPSSGIISIGNLTTWTTNNKTAEVLALSIWGWFPGLVTSTNWTLQRQVAESAASGLYTSGTLNVKELSYTSNSHVFSAIQFTYSQSPDLGNQNTTLIYDKDTGLLLEGFTELQFSHYYVLGLKLESSDLISVDTNLKTSSWSVFLSGLALSVFIIVYRFKRVKR
ncbi:MAG: hypothetical protein ACTSR2_08710 [Candidatus Hodarchaeales archaeon]